MVAYDKESTDLHPSGYVPLMEDSSTGKAVFMP